jgi:hypothetical protein
MMALICILSVENGAKEVQVGGLEGKLVVRVVISIE